MVLFDATQVAADPGTVALDAVKNATIDLAGGIMLTKLRLFKSETLGSFFFGFQVDAARRGGFHQRCGFRKLTMKDDVIFTPKQVQILSEVFGEIMAEVDRRIAAQPSVRHAGTWKEGQRYKGGACHLLRIFVDRQDRHSDTARTRRVMAVGGQERARNRRKRHAERKRIRNSDRRHQHESAKMTQAEAQMLLSQAKQTVDALIEHTLDTRHDALIRSGATEDMISEAMQSLYREADEARTATLIRMAEITAKRVEDGNVELH